MADRIEIWAQFPGDVEAERFATSGAQTPGARIRKNADRLTEDGAFDVFVRYAGSDYDVDLWADYVDGLRESVSPR